MSSIKETSMAALMLAYFARNANADKTRTLGEYLVEAMDDREVMTLATRLMLVLSEDNISASAADLAQHLTDGTTFCEGLTGRLSWAANLGTVQVLSCIVQDELEAAAKDENNYSEPADLGTNIKKTVLN